MLEIIKDKLKGEFENKLFDACLKNLLDKNNPLRLNNFANAMRELTRHILKRLAPDENVLKCSWYKNETENKNGITRKQRSYFAVQGGLSNSYISNTLQIDVEEIHKKLNNSIRNLSKYTHIEPSNFNLADNEIDVFTNEIFKSVLDFLLLIEECKKVIISNLEQQIQSATIDEVLQETILEIDELCSHHFIDEVYTNDIEICKVDDKNIIFKVSGTIGSEMQWGSNSDLRNDNGHVDRETFPFSCSLYSSVKEPDMIEVIENSLLVDTGEYLYKRYGQEEGH